MKTLVVLVLAAAAVTASPQPRRPPVIEEFVLLPNDDFESGPVPWFSRIPQWFDFSSAISDFMASLNPFGNIDEIMNKGNTTSETQVMNGTLITRNVTTYINKDTGTIVQVSSVDIRPSEKTPDEVEDVTPAVNLEPASKDPESTEAIDTNPSGDVADIDTPSKESNEIPNDQKPVEETIPLSARLMDYDKRNYLYPNTDYIDNDIEVFADNAPGDLQNDIYVNTVLEDKIRQSGGMHQLDPDVELIDVTGGRVADTFPNTQIQSKAWDLPEELQS